MNTMSNGINFKPMASTKYKSLQALSEKLISVPECYCVNPEPPVVVANSPMVAVPILDMATLTAQELYYTCKEWGMFQVLNHGVDSSLVKMLKHEVQEFYKLPLKEKMKYQRRSGEVEGYSPTVLFSPDQKIDWADKFLMMINPVYIRKPHLFPKLPSSLRKALEAYFKETENLAMQLLQSVVEALRVDEKDTVAMFEDGLQIVRMTCYPPCPEPGRVIGLTPQSDASAITILLQVKGVDGLQVKKDGIWFPVNILPEALVVNVGDILEILSNGILKSAEHRATVIPGKERISIAMFFNPKLQAEVGPANCLLTQRKPPLYKRVSAETYVKDFFSRKPDGKSYLDAVKIDWKLEGISLLLQRKTMQ